MASVVVKFALEKIGNILIQEGLLLYGVRDDIEWLQSELRWMECFLTDAERKEKKGDDERVKNWVMEVRDVVFQVEDVMDTIIEQIQKRRKLLLRRSQRIIRLLKRYALYPFELKALHNIATKIARIRTKVRGIKESKDTYGIVDLAHETRAESSRTQPLRQLHPHLDDDTVIVGFGVNKKVIVDRLLDTNMESRCVISIVGMGGLGKTTLASKVYNEIKSNFATCAWITVSQEYNATELLKCINRKVNPIPAQNIDSAEELVLNLKEFLKEKKYLIVMDDIWDTDVWTQVKAAFPNSRNGSRVLFTTRSEDVAKSADSRIPPVKMPYLNDKQSMELLLRKAFPTDQDVKPSCPYELEEAAGELIRKCNRLPLALVVLGGLLSVKEPTFNVWKDMAHSLNWDSTRDGKGCLEILALSYDDLSDHRLKSCFLYLGAWPEDSVIKASDLVWLWIGEGFVEPEAKKTMEETAMGYLDELAQRCMIQVVQRSLTSGRIKKFRIHDLLRDLCISVAKRMRFFTTYNYNNNNDAAAVEDVVTSRRLVVCKAHSDVGVQNADTMRSSHFKARSLLLLGRFSREEYEAFTESGSNLLGVPNSSTLLLQSFFHRFRLLRVIHLDIIKDERSTLNIPEEVGSLIHLRYLKVTCDKCTISLPSSIGNLSNLQTLDVESGNNLGLLELGGFELVGCRRGFHKFIPSSGIGRLKMLQILKNVRAGRWMRQLKELSSLRKLGITGISGKEEVDMLCDSLCKVDHLTSLYLQFQPLESLETETLFNSLPSHRNFRKLTLQGSSYTLRRPCISLRGLSQNLTNLSLEYLKVTQETVTTLEGLQGLVVLQIKFCTIHEEVYFRGGFPRLQHLRLVGLFNLRYLRIESGAMKDLAQLTIDECWDLRVMPQGLEHLASLKKLEVSRMPHNFVHRIRGGGEDFHKIQHIPSIYIN